MSRNPLFILKISNLKSIFLICVSIIENHFLFSILTQCHEGILMLCELYNHFLVKLNIFNTLFLLYHLLLMLFYLLNHIIDVFFCNWNHHILNINCDKNNGFSYIIFCIYNIFMQNLINLFLYLNAYFNHPILLFLMFHLIFIINSYLLFHFY